MINGENSSVLILKLISACSIKLSLVCELHREQRLEVTSTFIEAMEKELNEDKNSQNDKR